MSAAGFFASNASDIPPWTNLRSGARGSPVAPPSRTTVPQICMARHLQPRFIHLSVAHPLAAPTRQVALHRLPLADDECEQIGPIRITTPLRTVHDLASGGISQVLLNEVVADAVAIGRLDAHELYLSCANASVDVAVRVELALAASL